MARNPDVLDNTPWWLPEVSTGGAAGLLVQRCTAYGDMERGGPKHLEGGFYDLTHLGEHYWQCKARADGKWTMTCKCGHKGQVQDLCNGHVMMISKRGSGVCPRCVHPPEEVAIQEAMKAAREDRGLYAGTLTDREAAAGRALSKLWSLQAELDELVARGIVHRCGLTLSEVS